MKRKVMKFGGSSVASADQLRLVQQIVLKREDRGDIRAVVVSARGKDAKLCQTHSLYSVKETDELIIGYNALVGRDMQTDVTFRDVSKIMDMLGLANMRDITFDHVWELIAAPLRDIVRELELDLDIESVLRQSKAEIMAKRDLAFTKSRGEWHMAHIASDLLGLRMVDATHVFRFQQDGRLNEEQTLERLATYCSEPPCVIPGFYGADIGGRVHTFPRNGSDVTATWVARGLKADVCEIWSDTPGVYMADPRIIPREEWVLLDRLTYREAREAEVQALHEDAVRPLREMAAPIPIHMRDTTQAHAAGTWIMHERPNNGRRVQIITGRAGYIALCVYKTGYHDQVGGTIDILQVLKIARVPFHHISTGTDGAMIVVHKSVIKNGTLARVLTDIQANFEPRQLAADPEREVATISLVGDMKCSFEVIGRAGLALSRAGIIEGRFVDAGGSSGTIVIGVDADKLNDATLALHREFAPDVRPS